MATGIDINALSAAICKGVAEGNALLIANLAAGNDPNHSLRNKVQANIDKTWELDGEIKILKGGFVSLIGAGDGTSGMVPRLEKDLKQVGEKVIFLSSEMQELRTDVSNIGSDIKSIRVSQGESKTWMDGWRGVGIALGIMGTCATVIGGIVTALFWLFMHTK
jgi:hypothetical protein